jgi:hypothetical protein
MFAWGDAEFLVGCSAATGTSRGLGVSGNFFPAPGISPERGRLLGPGDDRRGCGAGSAVVSHAFRQTYFGGRESAIRSTLTLGSAVHGRRPDIGNRFRSAQEWSCLCSAQDRCCSLSPLQQLVCGRIGGASVATAVRRSLRVLSATLGSCVLARNGVPDELLRLTLWRYAGPGPCERSEERRNHVPFGC